jgi:hypothetical protein
MNLILMRIVFPPSSTINFLYRTSGWDGRPSSAQKVMVEGINSGEPIFYHTNLDMIQVPMILSNILILCTCGHVWALTSLRFTSKNELRGIGLS